MELMQGFMLYLFRYFLLNILDLFPKHLQDYKIIINDGIHEAVCQVVAAFGTDTSLALFYPFPNGIENVSRSLLERQHKSPAQYEAYLLCDDLPVKRSQHAKHDIPVVPKVLNLGALLGVSDILQYQRMDLEIPPKSFDYVHIMDAGDIYPGNGLFLKKAGTLLCTNSLLSETSRGKINDINSYRTFRAPDIHDSLRRQTCLIST